MHLNLQPNIASPDDFYEALVAAQRPLTDEQSQHMNARLVLLLANHIGDPQVWSEALTAARAAGEDVRRDQE